MYETKNRPGPIFYYDTLYFRCFYGQKNERYKVQFRLLFHSFSFIMFIEHLKTKNKINNNKMQVIWICVNTEGILTLHIESLPFK